MGEIKTAFDNLINALEKETLRKLKELEAKAEERRLARLKADLEKLNTTK